MYKDETADWINITPGEIRQLWLHLGHSESEFAVNPAEFEIHRQMSNQHIIDWLLEKNGRVNTIPALDMEPPYHNSLRLREYEKARGTRGPDKQFPHRKEVRLGDEEKSALDYLLTLEGNEDASDLIRRLLRNEYQREKPVPSLLDRLLPERGVKG